MSRAVARAPDLNAAGLTAGEWYLCCICANCRSRNVLFRDLTRGAGRIRATYMIECPACGNRTAYESEEIERYHHGIDEPSH